MMSNNEATDLVRRGLARRLEVTRTDIGDWVDRYGDVIEPIYIGSSRTATDSRGYAEKVWSVVVSR